ncbi:MAG TPA: CHAD domain-containing protein [Bryobacteraceae bacterium]|nr:CHAD domain-containing protein [Bryobacteraceae bacterium]
MAKDDALRWDGSGSPGANARRCLPELVATYYQEGRKAAAGDASTETLHDFRLGTKRLRYTIEMFRSCYGPGLGRCLDALGRIQDHLGAISDCATTGRTCQALLPEDSPDGKRLGVYLERRAAREAAAFRRYWRSEFDRAGEARRWEIYFRRKTK